MATEIPEALRRAADAFEDYLRVERGLARSTIKAYRRDVRRYLRHLAEDGVSRVEDVGASAVADALSRRAAQGVAASTLHRTLAAVRHFHRFCVREGLAPSNPAALVDGPQRGLSLPKALRPEEVERIIEAASGDSSRAQRDRAILEILYGAGLRVSELVGLDVDDVDLDERLLRCTGKGEKERIVPFGRPAAEAVRRYLRSGRREQVRGGTGTAAVFVSSRGKRLSRQSVWKVVKRYTARVYPEKRVYPHALRHSFATHLVARGADIRVVQEALGHARLSTTQVYTLVSRENLKETYEAAHPRGRADERAAAE